MVFLLKITGFREQLWTFRLSSIIRHMFLVKETVSRDFWPLVFFVKHLPLGHCFTPSSAFANNFEFTEIFELKVDSAVSLTPLSQKNFLRQPTFSSFCLKEVGLESSPLSGFYWIVSLKKMRTFKNSKINSAVSLLTQRCQWHRWVLTQRCQLHSWALTQRCQLNL